MQTIQAMGYFQLGAWARHSRLPGPCLVLTVLWSVALGKRAPPSGHVHPNVTSGDLLEDSDYSEPLKGLGDSFPPFMRRNSFGDVVVMFAMHYGEDDKIVDTSKLDLMITKKKPDESVNLSQIWHIHKEDDELKLFFAKVFDLDPSDVTIVHIAFSKKESIKKVLIKEQVMGPEEILAKIKSAEGKTI